MAVVGSIIPPSLKPPADATPCYVIIGSYDLLVQTSGSGNALKEVALLLHERLHHRRVGTGQLQYYYRFFSGSEPREQFQKVYEEMIHAGNRHAPVLFISQQFAAGRTIQHLNLDVVKPLPRANLFYVHGPMQLESLFSKEGKHAWFEYVACVDKLEVERLETSYSSRKIYHLPPLGLKPHPTTSKQWEQRVLRPAKQGKVNLLLVASKGFEENKGFYILEKLARRRLQQAEFKGKANPAAPSWNFFVIGDWTEQDKQPYAAENLTFLQPTSNMAALLDTMDVSLNMSAKESYSRITDEALICGVPVIATDLPVYRQRGDAIYQYVPLEERSNEEAWEKAIESLLQEVYGIKTGVNAGKGDNAESSYLDRLNAWQKKQAKEYESRCDRWLKLVTNLCEKICQ